MHARFLLGPSGTGKTCRCIEEIRARLLERAEGPPLVFLSPKQATFQLERQLLSDPALQGYTRLQILSFDRLAEFVLDTLGAPVPPLVNEEGRLMILRAILGRKRDELGVFRASARLPGFAAQLSEVLRELQHARVIPREVCELANVAGRGTHLGDKLHDLGLLYGAYLEWLSRHHLQDADCLLDVAGRALGDEARRARTERRIAISGLWLDGFAEMTPQETNLLAALAAFCEEATLAFCVDVGCHDQLPGASTWRPVVQTWERLRDQLACLPGVRIEVEALDRSATRSRFAGSPILAHLESAWNEPRPWAGLVKPGPPTMDIVSQVERSLRVVRCASPEAEAVYAAREILRFVREGGARFRDAAVIVRSLDSYHDVIRAAFKRYEIPFFLDRREPAAHHALAELTRHALRVIAFGWEHDDWFGALKTGLVSDDENGIDCLENEALAHGWKGRAWLRPINVPDDPALSQRLEALRQRIVPPFVALGQRLGQAQADQGGDGWLDFGPCAGPAGSHLAAALRRFYQELDVELRLAGWADAKAPADVGEDTRPAGVHTAVWEQINAWLADLEHAFSTDTLPLREWLPILESGLANLSVGVIPPSIDQVLVGAIDRSRNPDLRLSLLLGMNEGVFPAPPAQHVLITDAEREVMARHAVELGSDWRKQLWRERYFGYIAFTRARERVVVTYAVSGADGEPLNPSPFLTRLARLLPTLEEENARPAELPPRIEHSCEVVGPLARAWQRITGTGLQLPSALLERLARMPPLDAGAAEDSIPSSLAVGLYGGGVLRTSVSRIERFAACQFRFFLDSGLRLQERTRFEVDARQRGSFQHLALARFHERLKLEGKTWSDLEPAAAREYIARIALDLVREFGEGLFEVDDRSLFSARSLTRSLEDFIEIIVDWMRVSYHFRPEAVELAFGGPKGVLPAWELDVDGHRLSLRGVVDRVDLDIAPDGKQASCVVVDYKSGIKKVDPLLLEHGIQLQLPAYMAALERLPETARHLGVEHLVPAGVFYVSLRAAFKRARNRLDAGAQIGLARKLAYRHRGRFNSAFLPRLDSSYSQPDKSGQFSYYRDGRPHRNFRDPLAEEQFKSMLSGVEQKLRDMGRKIFAGQTRVSPYRKGAGETACTYCDFAPICRIDPWTHEYRRLQSAPEVGDA